MKKLRCLQALSRLLHSPAAFRRPRGRRWIAITGLSLLTTIAQSEVIISNIPLSVRQNVKPMIMLVASKDHRLYYEAYNDASDIDGDGVLDIRFKPGLTYLGLFNPALCYEHNGATDNTGLFTPVAVAQGAWRTCAGKWSGNWLNYATTSRIDAIRVALYGGMREVQSDGQTILRRAYIPQDAHSWAKEYTGTLADGYKITDYTPLEQPESGKRHFFGNLTRAEEGYCSLGSACSSKPPLLSVVKNSSVRVWDWASTERPVLSKEVSVHAGTLSEYTVRVLVCTLDYHEGCKAYGTTPVYRPVGLLHEFGETESMLFGLLSGSYDKSMSGGRLRKVVSSFKGEVDAKTGAFKQDAAIVNAFNAFRIRDFNFNSASDSYRGGWVTTAAPREGQFPDWGNPIGEMMYESLRYYAGKGSASAAFAGSTTADSSLGLGTANWDDPYSKTGAAKAPLCARANLLVISDPNVSYDSDQVPGAYEGFKAPDFIGDLGGFDASIESAAITRGEKGIIGQHFIGQSEMVFDATPSPKEVKSLASIRGLAPEEPTKQGSYSAAAAAYFGRRTDLRPRDPGKQGVETFVVALASPLPRIIVPLSTGKKITLVPFAKSVAGSSISNVKGHYQPTNQIVDFYVESLANSTASDFDTTINGGRYFASFRISYEDVEQGADHDMDVVVQYIVQLNLDNTVTVTLKPLYEGGGIKHRIGYVISGTQKDGVYLEVQDEADTTPYFLNTPPGKDPGYCDAKPSPADCQRLPHLGGTGPDAATRTFIPGSGSEATLLQDPLWYAAKWGAFKDRNGNGLPDLAAEWDENGDGIPDTYIPVQNPQKLREALRKAMENILARSSSASALSSNSTRLSTSTRLFQAVFDTRRWSGDLIAWPANGNGAQAVPDWQASQAIPAWRDRKIFLHTASGRVSLLDPDSLPGIPAEKVNYLRGDRSQEVQNGGTLRDRASPLGDIVHASPVHDPETDTVFISANDGMLHALRGSNGQELFAFIPEANAARIGQLASLAYEHRFLLDGELARAPRGPLTGNRRYLYALLGRGGKGLFSLDVTEPTQFDGTSLLWEYSSGTTSPGATDLDLGLMLGRPVIAALNNGKLGVILGNGYNSSSSRAVLYIFIVNADGRLDRVRKLETPASGENGLAGPAILDDNRDGKADWVYAGDLQGNVWKFDLRAADPADWKLALDGKPLFEARDQANNAQPITAPLLAVLNDRPNDPNFGKPYVFFGTGAYFREGDPADANTQTWYGLADTGTPISTGRLALTPRTIVATAVIDGRPARAFSVGTEGDMTNRRGWYLDLGSPNSGERIVTASRIVQLSAPALVAASLYPVSDEPCASGGRGYLNLVDPYTGAALAVGVVDIAGDGDYSNDKIGLHLVGSVDLGVGLPSEPTFLRQDIGKTSAFISGSGSPTPDGTGLAAAIHRLTLKSPPSIRRRITWREIIKD